MHTKALPSVGSCSGNARHPKLTGRRFGRVAAGLVVCLVAGLMLGSECMSPPTDDPGDDDNTAPVRKEVTLYTNLGKIVIQLYPEQAPEAVQKFLDLADEEAYYDGKIFHDARSTFLVAGAYDVDLEDGEDVPFVNESNNGLKNIRGRVAFYGPTDEESGKPQFLINLGDNPNLNYTLGSTQKPPFTVIGRVIQGMDIADDIAELEKTQATSSGGDALENIPQTTAGHKVRILLMTSEESEEPANTPPTAAAGPDQVVQPNAKVTLDGSQSDDPDDDPIAYAWSITDASAEALEAAQLQVALSDATAMNPTFTAPTPKAPIDVVFELKVTDDRGESATDTVKVTLSDNTTPTAKAGDDKTAHPGDSVQLDGSGSSDPDEDSTLTYAWTIAAESRQLLEDRGLPVPPGGTAAKYTFTAPLVTAPVPLTFELTVTDNKGAEATDTVEVKILPIAFNAAVSYIVGDAPSAIATADFNGDSKPDVVVTKSATDQVAVLLNDGEGVLLTPALYTVGDQPDSLVVADFNIDGAADIAVADRGDNTLAVLLNNGDGTFAAADAFDMGTAPFSLTSGDFDGASGPDVAAITTASANSLAVKTNDGQAGFNAGDTNLNFTGKDDNSATVTPSGARAVAAGKIDTDGFADLAVAYADRKVFIMLGDTSKTENFRFGSYFEAGSGATDPRAIALTDVSNDSKLDVAVVLNALDKVSIRKNTGSGRFGFEALYDTGDGPVALVGADLDGDKDADLAIANETANTITILQNKGTGSFKAKVDLNLAAQDAGPVGVVAADFNGDEAIDLAVVNKTSGMVSVILNLIVAADAGEDQDVLVGEQVTLHGSGKSRVGAAFTYAWTQTAGPTVTLSDPTATEPTFTAPSESCELIFRLTATDDQGATATDTVRIDVYVQTASGLKYCDVVKGTGAVVQPTSTVSVLYTGKLNNRAGNTFDTTAPDNQPRDFQLGGLIDGWKEGLGNYDMRAGGTRLLIIPPELGYGDNANNPDIPPNSTLWFEIEVVEVK